ncbi:MAG: SpoVA/SpoVAEb family sporulation membrane protein [Synergistaceae bacterium]|jgi:stage V sporulation protein AE|nr:SpoVA/SpoVAEb family sporulation membrane protein [Synergistaceae bacterium]
MIYAKAFIASGLLCLIGQLLMANTKLGFVRIFTIGICSGVVLTAFGLMTPIVNFGLGGIIVSVVDAGEALYAGFRTAMDGNFSPIIGFWIMIAGVFSVGIISGLTMGLSSKNKAVNDKENTSGA